MNEWKEKVCQICVFAVHLYSVKSVHVCGVWAIFDAVVIRIAAKFDGLRPFERCKAATKQFNRSFNNETCWNLPRFAAKSLTKVTCERKGETRKKAKKHCVQRLLCVRVGSGDSSCGGVWVKYLPQTTKRRRRRSCFCCWRKFMVHFRKERNEIALVSMKMESN